jgi:deoxyribodipyrimidine photolyase-related protein
MKEAVLIFPHQLFQNHPGFAYTKHVILVEDPLLFGVDVEYPVVFHKQKLMLHRATMRAYADDLRASGREVTYVEICKEAKDYITLWKRIAEIADTLHIADVVDDVLRKRIETYSKQLEVTTVWHDSPNFYLTEAEVTEYFSSHSFFQHNFYKAQRQKFGILMTSTKKPQGGSWSFDDANRNKLPKGIRLPEIVSSRENAYITEARSYVQAYFKHNPGQTLQFAYPVTRQEALAHMEQFFIERFAEYGTYQDAITNRAPFLFHSLLSSSINIGLLQPQEVIDRAIAHAAEHDIPMNALEGFVRQILGWREYMRGVYQIKGRYERTNNYFGYTNKLADCWYTGETGIPPLDDVIKKVDTYAYAHHIERLMIVGNLMLLCEIDPDEVYRWFMELFIDAYDWVMVPNVYGMTQYADGGLIVTKPYVSSSNYIRKMSDYKKGEWCDTWDALYWRFVAKHRSMLEQNARMHRVTYHLDKFGEEKVVALTKHATTFIQSVTK